MLIDVKFDYVADIDFRIGRRGRYSGALFHFISMIKKSLLNF